MSKPGKVLRTLCKKLGVRLTIKRGQKRVYKSIAVLKRQCKKKVKKKKVKRKRKVKKRRRKFGTSLTVEKDGKPFAVQEGQKDPNVDYNRDETEDGGMVNRNRSKVFDHNKFPIVINKELIDNDDFKIDKNNLIFVNDTAGIWRYLYVDENSRRAKYYIDNGNILSYSFEDGKNKLSSRVIAKMNDTNLIIQPSRKKPTLNVYKKLNYYLATIISTEDLLNDLKRDSSSLVDKDLRREKQSLLGEFWQFIDKKSTNLEHKRFLHKIIESIVLSNDFFSDAKIKPNDNKKFIRECSDNNLGIEEQKNAIDECIRVKMKSLIKGDNAAINKVKGFFQFLKKTAESDAKELGLLRENLVKYHLNIDPNDIRDVIIFANNKDEYTKKLKGIYERHLYTYQDILFKENGEPRFSDVVGIFKSDENVFKKIEKLEDYVDKYMAKLKRDSGEEALEEVLNKMQELWEKYDEKQELVEVLDETDAPVLSRRIVDTYEDKSDDRDLSHSFENLITHQGQKHFHIIDSMEKLRTNTDYMALQPKEQGGVPIEGIGIDHIRKQGTIEFKIGEKVFSFKLERNYKNESKFKLYKSGFYINDIKLRFKAGQSRKDFTGTISMHPKNNEDGTPNPNSTFGRFHFKLEDNATNSTCYYKFSLEQGELGRMQIHALKDIVIRLKKRDDLVNPVFMEDATILAIKKYVNHILRIMYNKGLYRFGKKRKKKKRKNNFGKKKNKISKNMKQLCKKLGIRLTIKRGQKRVYKSIAVLKAQCLKKKRKVKKKVKKKRKVKKKKVKKKSKRKK